MRAPRGLIPLTLANTAAALVYPLITLVFSASPNLHLVWGQFRHGLVYSWCIGTTAFLVMNCAGPAAWRLPKGLRYAGILVTLIAIGVAGTLIANVLLLAIGWTSRASFWWQFRSSVRIAVVITVAMGLVIAAFESLQSRLQNATLELRTRQLAEERALKLATEARLSSLESRIHPHFLFNTLNSISALIREDAPRAERTVEHLAALLRYSLDAGGRRLVPLSQELHIVRDYLEIERTRLGERLRYHIDVAEALGDLPVPPLALQTLVENSVKHVVSANRHGGEIGITARLGAGRLSLEVTDDGPGFDLRALQPGHGLENLQDRLSALFDGEGRLELGRREGRMRVSVSIPQGKVFV